MKRISWVLPIAAAICGAAYGQTFEVASIRPAAPPEMGIGGKTMFRMGKTGGPGTKDPTSASYANVALIGLIAEAYDMKSYQLTAPEWMDSARFDVKVKVAEGTTPEDYRVMLQNLLMERFKLTFHRDKKEMPVYELVVGKGGPKMKETVEVEGPELDEAAAREKAMKNMAALRDKVMANPRAAGQMTTSNTAITMAKFAATLSNMVNRPVTDATGLTAKYDITLSFAPDPSMRRGPAGMPGGGGGMAVFSLSRPGGGDPGGGPGPDGSAASTADVDSAPTIFGAIQDQLGLKLEPKKGQVDMIVIDHAEKVPTEN
jgi:uncharacterized protein (TIGR03435 family)